MGAKVVAAPATRIHRALDPGMPLALGMPSMKRASTLLLAPVLPAIFLFVLTARPARLYAESAAQLSCDEPDIATCAGKSHGDACLGSQGAGFCQPYFCRQDDPDAGFTGPPLQPLMCLFAPSCATGEQIAACAGKTEGDACGSGNGAGACWTSTCPLADGGTSATFTACVARREPTRGTSGGTSGPTTGGANGASGGGASNDGANGNDGGCNVAHDASAVSSVATGLALAAAALLRVVRRRRVR